MIRYDLLCGDAHGFEGWFSNSAAFARQCAGGLIACPQCGGTAIRQALAAPAVVTARRGEPKAAAAETGAPLRAGPPDALLSALQGLRREIERQCDDVGDDFAAEAFRIERGEARARGIYGRASDEDRERLEDAGIEVVAVPWVRRADS